MTLSIRVHITFGKVSNKLEIWQLTDYKRSVEPARIRFQNTFAVTRTASYQASAPGLLDIFKPIHCTLSRTNGERVSTRSLQDSLSTLECGDCGPNTTLNIHIQYDITRDYNSNIIRPVVPYTALTTGDHTLYICRGY